MLEVLNIFTHLKTAAILQVYDFTILQVAHFTKALDYQTRSFKESFV